METGLLNMIENPKTPTKLVISRRTKSSAGDSPRSAKAPGDRLSISAMTQAVIVEMTTMITAYASRSRPERISSFARSIPLVINGSRG